MPEYGSGRVEAAVLAVVVLILAGMAVPQRQDQATVNRCAEVRALAGSIRSAALLGHALWEARGHPATLEVPGGKVAIVNGYPAAGDIARLMEAPETLAFTQAGGEFRHRDVAAGTRCGVSYAAPGRAGAEPEARVELGGC